MHYFLYGLLTVIGIGIFSGALFALLVEITDFDGLRSVALIGGSALVIAAFIGGFIYLVQQGEEKGPCLQEATGYAYNAATKTDMQYTYCAERGTWAK